MSSANQIFNLEFGYVKLPRAVIDHEIMQDAWLCCLFMWCLLKANFRARGGLEVGQFVTGRNIGSAELGVHPSRFYRGLNRLQEMGVIETETNNKNTVVTVCGYRTLVDPQESHRATGEQVAEQVNSDTSCYSLNGSVLQGQIADHRESSQGTVSSLPEDTLEEYKNLRIKEPPPPFNKGDTFGIGRTAKRAKAPQSDRPAWVAAVEEELLDLGIDDLNCLQQAIDAGLIEPAIRELLRHYREHRQAQDWTPKALHYRLRTAKTSLPSDRGWPQPGPAAERHQVQSEQQRQRQRQQQQHQEHQAERQSKDRERQEREKRYGAELDAMTADEVRKLAHSLGTDFEKRLKAKQGDRTNRSIRGLLLLKLEENHCGQALISMKEAL